MTSAFASGRGSTGDDDRVAQPRALRVVWLGAMAFDQALDLQLATREAILAEKAPDTLYLVEHPPTLTVGRRGSRDDILWNDARLREAGVGVFDTPRGGEVTLHAPGQLVAYPVVSVGRKIRQHLLDMGEVTRRLLAHYGVAAAEFRMEHPGVWLGSSKIASVGVHVSRGVSVQGIAINLDVDPSLFGALVSCGIRGISMTSVTAVGGVPEPVPRAAKRWADDFATETGRILLRET